MPRVVFAAAGLMLTASLVSCGGGGKPTSTTTPLGRPSGSIIGHTWQVATINNGTAVVGVIDGTSLTARFGDDGHVSGSAGCNHYSATYTLDGSALHVGPAIATRKHCESPAGVMQQESEFLHALEQSRTVEAGESLVALRDARNTIQLTLNHPEPP